jgi:alkaline phosphatase D
VGERLDAEADATWTVLGNSTALTSLIVDLEPFAALLGGVLPATKLYLNVDQWDGFPAIRKLLFDQLKAKNAVIISGDIHAAYITDYGTDPNNPDDKDRVVELTGPGVSSGSFAAELKSTAESIPGLAGSSIVDQLLMFLDTLLLPMGFSPALKYSNSSVNGVVVVNLSATQLEGKYALLDGPIALMDKTSTAVTFMRKTATVTKVDGKNGSVVVT